MTDKTAYAISIIIPVYNCETYIVNCLNSIKAQTFSDYELIIVNDCSDDNSERKIHNFMQCNPQVTCTYIANSTQSGATISRNKGRKLARGTYVCFMDSDDSYHPLFLEYLYDEIERTNVDFVFCGYNRCLDNDIIPYTKSWKYPSHRSIIRLKFDFLTGKSHICHCTILFRRSYIDTIGLYYINGCRHAGDTEFVCNMLFHNPTFSCVNQSLYNYNIHANSVSTKTPTSENFDAYFAYERVKNNIKNPLWKLLFIITRESREVFHILENFFSLNLELPYLFCSKYKILILLTTNMLIKQSCTSHQILKHFWSEYIRIK